MGDPYAPDSGATGYDALHYDITFSYDPDGGRVEGVTTMTAAADEALAGFSVDLHQLDMEAVTVDGEDAEFEVEGRDERHHPGRADRSGEEFVTEMTYTGVPQPVISAGFPTGWLTTDDGGAYVIGEPDGAATWFPGNDHPSDKATMTLEATVPRGWVVASNGAFEGRRRDGDAVTWAWSEDDPIATYLVTVAIDKFRVVEEETDSGLPLVSFYPEDDADRLTEDFADAGRSRSSRSLSSGRTRSTSTAPSSSPSPSAMRSRPRPGRPSGSTWPPSTSSRPTSWPTSGSATRSPRPGGRTSGSTRASPLTPSGSGRRPPRRRRHRRRR